MRAFRIGTRGSLLARWQAESVRKQLFALTGVEAEIVVIKTAGDKLQQAPLTQIDGKGIFIKELEEALLDESVDLAVHSVKDIPTDTPSRLCFPAVCKRADVRDCLFPRTALPWRTFAPARVSARAVCGGRPNCAIFVRIWIFAICAAMWIRACERWRAASTKRLSWPKPVLTVSA